MSVLTPVPHPWEGARTIDLLDYLATRLVDERDQYSIAQGQFRSEEIRARCMAMDRFDEAYMWHVAAENAAKATADALEGKQ